MLWLLMRGNPISFGGLIFGAKKTEASWKSTEKNNVLGESSLSQGLLMAPT